MSENDSFQRNEQTNKNSDSEPLLFDFWLGGIMLIIPPTPLDRKAHLKGCVFFFFTLYFPLLLQMKEITGFNSGVRY